MQPKTTLKTVIDALIGGLISIGVFQSPTFVLASFTSYVILVAILFMIMSLIILYAKLYREEETAHGTLIALVLSLLEVFLIGFALLQPLDMIITVWLIIFPSVVIFDKLLG